MSNLVYKTFSQTQILPFVKNESFQRELEKVIRKFIFFEGSNEPTFNPLQSLGTFLKAIFFPQNSSQLNFIAYM